MKPNFISLFSILILKTNLNVVINSTWEHLGGVVAERDGRHLVAAVEGGGLLLAAWVPHPDGAVVRPWAEHALASAHGLAAVDDARVALEALDATTSGDVPQSDRFVRAARQQLHPVCGEMQLENGASVAAHHGDVLTLAIRVPEN